MSQIGVIGGSGVYKLEEMEIVKEIQVDTPFGNPSDKIIEGKIEGQSYFFIPRHGRNHTLLPSEVNYLANIYALKSIGVDVVVSVSAVGSLKEEHRPTDFVLVDQFIDWTKGQRRRSFFGNGMIGHVSVANPIEKVLQERIYKSAKKCEIDIHLNGTYLCIEGPQFSSRAESHIYRQFGADVIGMTNVPEAYLAKEAGMAYATIAMVTDYDCWKDEHCTVDEIMKVMQANNKSVQKILLKLLPDLTRNPISFEKENKVGLMTSMDVLTLEKRSIIDMLLR